MVNKLVFRAVGCLAALILLLGASPAAGQQPAEPMLGFHIGRGDGQHMAAARAAGGRFVVLVFSWANIEPEPNYLYWERPDAALRAAEFYGLEVVARLDQPPAWALDDSGPTPWKLEAYANFARRVADRYGSRLAGVVLWNEPNLSLEWHDQPPDAAAYAEMLRAAYPAVKEAAPNLPVFMAGLASTEGEGDWAINDLDYLQALYAAGAAPYFDGLTAHPYGFGRPPDEPPGKYRPNFRRLELYRQVMAANDDAAKPVWVTEMGWLTWTDDPRHEWQVVTPQAQADYIQQALAYAGTHYPWLERLAVWELNSEGDRYGYAIWQGPEQVGPAYEGLVERCASRSPLCDGPPEQAGGENPLPVTILAPDAVIRLGDRDTLHPHWVHLQGGRLEWSGEFFLTVEQVGQPYHLLLETMQVNEATNRLLVNGVEVGRLWPRSWPNSTSTWTTQRFALATERLQPGLNTLTVVMGPRNPARQYVTARWENMQFRHVRLEQPFTLPDGGLAWQPRPAPGGWSEVSHLRPGLAGDFWLTGIRPGQLWHGSPDSARLENRGQPGLIFNDLLPLPQGHLAATSAGLRWQAGAGQAWQPVSGAPAAFAYVVGQAYGQFYAGFEGEGLWSAPAPTGPWQPTPLADRPVLDLYTTGTGLGERLYAVTPDDILTNDGPAGDGWHSMELPGLAAEVLEDAGEWPGDKFRPALFTGSTGELVVRHQDRLWRFGGGGWDLYGPEGLHGKQLGVLNCCGPGALIYTNRVGLWQLGAGGRWQRIDGDFFSHVGITALQPIGDRLYAEGEVGLVFSDDGGRTWQGAEGLPPTTGDLLVDPANPARWLAGTPVGVYGSPDGGRSWQAVGPPRVVWDMAFGPQGRLFVGRRNGLAWADELSASPIPWHIADGMEQVYFLSVNPHPVEPGLVWTGTWGNNIGVSEDGGQSIEPLHNGLETLSGLDLIWHPTPGQVTLATIEGLYRTDDGGGSWFKLPGPLVHQTVYSLLQGEDGAIWAGAADGLWVSRDYGVTWSRAGGLPAVTVLRLGTVGPEGRLWAGTERGGLWLQGQAGEWQFAGLAGLSVYNLFGDPLQPGQWVAATDGGVFAAAERR